VSVSEQKRSSSEGGEAEVERLRREVDALSEARTRLEHARSALEIENAGLREALAMRDVEVARMERETQEFVYVASHDLKEPLRMIASFTELVRARYHGQIDEKADRYVQYASDGARRLQGVLASLLAYSRVSTGGSALVPVDLSPVVDHVLDRFNSRMVTTGSSVTVDPMPSVLADPAQARQLFEILFDNAFKFRGSRPLSARLGASREGDTWLLSLADNGIGIDPRYHPRVFTIFQRFHDRDAYAGTGSGLAIAKRIVERHGGRIGFDSELGIGTTIHFTLPAYDARIDA
jgi:light-regulated signal transduction histidine kinase (bacteriophytochrome)